jgi:1,4-dihydroxy-2-naphthoate octaprenyltransferase
MLNDYYDFQKGQDQEKWVTSNKPTNGFAPLYHLVPSVAYILFSIAIILGSWVGFESNTLWILVIGGIGVLCGYKYSAGPRSLSSLGLAEVIAFLFLGIFPAFVGYVVQIHSIDLTIVALALPYSLVVSTMLLTNNIRDIEKDENIRRTVAMRLGRNKAVLALTMILTTAYLMVIILIIIKFVSPIAFVTLIALPAALRLRWLLRRGASRVEVIKSMKCSAIHHWIFGMALALSIWFSA